MNYEVWNYKEFKDKVKELAENPRDVYCVSERPDNIIAVSLGANSKYTKEDIVPPCEPANDLVRNGGTIIIFPQNIMFMIFKYEPNTRFSKVQFEGAKIKKAIVKYLQSKHLFAVVDNNDILVNGHKVAGDMSRKFSLNKDINIYAIQISINVDLDIIRKYCDKEMKKIPAGLSQWGITREEILKVIDETISKG